MARYAARSVATQSITTNRAKNSSEEPRSFCADHDDERDAPRQQHRPEVLRGRGAAADPMRRLLTAEQLAPLDEVRGEEDRQERSWRTRRAGS